jgi:dipeptidase E
LIKFEIKMRLLVVSTSTIHGSGYLEYILPEIKAFFKDKKNILFVPYARPGGISFDEYTNKARGVFE